MLPVVEPDGESTARGILYTCLALIPVSLLPSFLSMTGGLYLAGATLLGIFFIRSAVGVFRNRTALRARSVLIASVVYLPVLYGLMVLDRQGL
jgi:protoheme IX farnesyltransferase